MKLVAQTFIVFALAAVLVTGVLHAEDPPGIVISKSPDFETTHICSPSIAILPNGDFVATHCWFGPEVKTSQTIVFKSSDRGNTWNQIATIEDQFWSTLFAHQSSLYLFGTNKRYGSLVFRRSDDGGKTWTEPKDESTGLLLEGAYYTAPVPFVVHENRIWRSIEQMEKSRSLVMVISAPEDADLLDGSNWTISDPVAMDPNHFGGSRDRMLEGNVVAHPEAGLANLMRVDNPRADRAAILPISGDGERLTYASSRAFIDFPGGRSKFTVRYDRESKLFWSISNKQHNPYANRNMLVLSSSPNLRDWTVKTILIHHVDSLWHGCFYPDWQFDGDDLVVVCETSWNGAKSWRMPNYLTFHRVENFRTLVGTYLNPIYGRMAKVSFEHPDFQLSGSRFSIQDFKNDATAFASFGIQFKDVPDQFTGWKFTKTAAGCRVQMQLLAKRDCDLYMMTAAAGGGVIDVTGWEPVDIASFYYSDRNKTPMAIFSRSVKSGERIEIPQGNWTGGMLLIPPEK